MGGGRAAVFVYSWVHPCWGPLAGFARCFRPFSSVLLTTRQISASYRIMGLGPPVLGGGLVAFSCCLPSSGPPEIFTWHLLPIPPPPSLPCQVPSPYNGTAYVLWPRCSFTPYSSSHNAYIKV